jgi:hypothetical protein
VLAGGVVAGLLLFGVATASPAPKIALDEPPAAGSAAPPIGDVRQCGYVIGKRSVNNTFDGGGGAICGSQYPDKITVTGRKGSSSIWTFGGVDYVNAKNKKPDEIWNGPGRDSGAYDSCDVVHDIDAGQVAPGKCPGVKASSGLRSLAAIDYPGYLPVMDCRLASDGRRLIRFDEEPAMRAVDATSRVDWQTVAWSGLMYKWDGTKWVFVVQTLWRYDRTYDEQVDAFPGNYWRLFTTNERSFVSFYPSGPGQYRIAIHYRWYKEGRVPNHDLLVWAGQHLGRYEDYPGQEWCNFPGETPPPSGGASAGHYTGTTSAGTALSFDVSGTSITNLAFAPISSSNPCSDAGLGVFQNGFNFGTVSGLSATIAGDGSFTASSNTTNNITDSGGAVITQGQLNVSVSGRFSGATATGTLQEVETFTYQGVAQRCDTKTLTWSARK